DHRPHRSLKVRESGGIPRSQKIATRSTWSPKGQILYSCPFFKALEQSKLRTLHPFGDGRQSARRKRSADEDGTFALNRALRGSMLGFYRRHQCAWSGPG